MCGRSQGKSLSFYLDWSTAGRSWNYLVIGSDMIHEEGLPCVETEMPGHSQLLTLAFVTTNAITVCPAQVLCPYLTHSRKATGSLSKVGICFSRG